MAAFERPAKTIPRSIGHHREWVDACRAGRPEDAKAGFWYSAPFTEALLVGLLPIYAGKRIQWDARTIEEFEKRRARISGVDDASGE